MSGPNLIVRILRRNLRLACSSEISPVTLCWCSSFAIDHALRTRSMWVLSRWLNRIRLTAGMNHKPPMPMISTSISIIGRSE
ncbi:MAG: hypothetical protein BWY82_01101 [Verrucomicrobia bacterium ADurb.Bin474]|nr:MAG: hypothetical protein BWY82_01101 [Verrucomicrobia bacterium ADurb.Bin474]